MKYFVFRNQTVEFLFGKDASFSGYDDISLIPQEAETYVWFYQPTPAPDPAMVSKEITSWIDKLLFIQGQKPKNKDLVVLLPDEVFTLRYTSDDFRIKQAISDFNRSVFTFIRSACRCKGSGYS